MAYCGSGLQIAAYRQRGFFAYLFLGEMLKISEVHPKDHQVIAVL